MATRTGKATIKAVPKGPGSDDDFVFDSTVGEIVVPSLASAPRPNQFELIEAMATDDEIRGNMRTTHLLLKAAAGEEMFALIKRLPSGEDEQFMEAWVDHSGVGLGESRRS
jgi:hypothetical protein